MLVCVVLYVCVYVFMIMYVCMCVAFSDKVRTHSAQFAHKNGRSRIIYVKNVRFVHQFSHFLMVMIEKCTYVL